MDEIWERAVELALDGQTDHAAARTLTLDGAVKCVQGWLPPLSLLEKFENLQHLSVANIGVSSLEQFPRLRNLQKLILSDNCIPGGLEFLVEAGLDSLRDLDLSNNRIQFLEDLVPLAQLKLISLDLYECPVTRVKDYRSRVFGLIKSLKYLDKMDAEENERPESDDEEDEEEDEDEDDPGSGEIDGEERPFRMNNGHSEGAEGIVDVDADEESDAAEEETETGRSVDGPNQNGFRVAAVEVRDDVDDEEGDDDYENESEEEIDEEEGDDDDDDDDVVEVHEIEDSDDEVDGVEDEDDDDEEDDDDDEEEEEDELEEVDNDEGDFAEPVSTGRLTSTEGEIDAHEHGEDDDDNDNGETGEEEQGVEDDGEFEDEEDGEEDEEEDSGYLVQPVGQAEMHDAGGSGGEVRIEEEEEEDDPEGEEEVEDDEEVEVIPSSSSSQHKRKRDEEDLDEDDEEEDNDVAEYNKSSKKQR